jgi:RNA polymerase primary sigma factor
MSLSDYLNAVGKVPLLTAQEEIILGTQVQRMMKILADKQESELTEEERKHVRVGRRAKNRMVSANLRLVVNVAKKFRPQAHMKMEDILQEGSIGLMRAVEKFDPERGYKFSTYAYWWIRQGITRAGENQEAEIRVPAHLQRIAKQAADARSKLLSKNGRQPTVKEVALAINEPDPKKIEYAIAHQVYTFSLDISLLDGDKSPLLDIMNCDDESEIEDNENNKMKMDLLMLAINALDPVDGSMIKKRYGVNCEPHTIKQLSAEFNLSPQAIRDRINKAMNRIRIVVSQFV